jgi:2-dehydro-3-deoxyphosphogluconate aldolase/(4S)-4-hydroxy-2-oxoglutarate aldolase
MSQRSNVTTRIKEVGAVAIIRMQESARVARVVEAVLRGGLSAIEITMSVPGAVELLREVARSLGSEVVLGAGTVLDVETAKRVIDAGASFVVSPILKRELIAECHANDVAVAPGCFTPTEIYTAFEAEADLIKVFPATSLGPAFFRDILAPLPGLPIMPTGGVSLDNVGDWIRAGAVAVGVGTALLDRQVIAAERYEELTARARALVAAVRAARDARA